MYKLVQEDLLEDVVKLKEAELTTIVSHAYVSNPAFLLIVIALSDGWFFLLKFARLPVA